MRKSKLIITWITICMVAVSLSIFSACASEEPQVIEEPVVEEPVSTEQTAPAEEPEEPVVSEEVKEEEESISIAGEPELLWVFEHEDLRFDLNCVAVSPDGETLAVGSYLTTYTHYLYDGELIDVNTSHRHSVDDIGFSPDGSIMGVGVTLGGVSLIDVEENQEIIQLHGGYDNRLSFSPDGKYIATGNRSGLVWVWDVGTGEQIMELEAPENDFLLSIEYHPSGNILSNLLWTDEATVYIWDLETKNIVQEIELNILAGSAKTPFKFSPDGNIMAGFITEDWDHKVRFWDMDGKIILDVPFESRINEINFSPDSRMLAVASLYEQTTIWDTETGSLLYTLDQILEETIDGTRALAFTPDGGHLAVVRNRGPLEFWRLPGAEPIEEPQRDIKEPPPIPGDVLFDTGSSELKTEADSVLDALASDLFAALPVAKITFIGHTDSRGDAASNLSLSLDRATAVKEWFAAWANENGADGWELFVDGKGDTELKVSDVDQEGTFREEAGRINRRVEIEIE
jgi:WD40 repeat protein